MKLQAIILTISALFLLSCTKSTQMQWTHFTIANPLPGEAWGTGGLPLADFDGDGDLDISLSRRESKTVYWYERVNDSTWTPHTIFYSDTLSSKLGAAALDIDNDGWIDVVYPNWWFKNPGSLADNPDAPWTGFPFDGKGHDIIAGHINGDGRLDIIAYDGKHMYWFDPAQNLKKYVIGASEDYHGGVAPHGFGDLDNDGDVDVVIPGLWFANPGDGTGDWQAFPWPHLAVENASYGTSMRCWVADINNDGHQDIMYSDCDTGGSHVYWVKNMGDRQKWERFQLDDPPTAPGDVPGTGSFHSLGVADFDLDGDLDIFAGEQEDPDTYMESNGRVAMKPVGLKERGVMWQNNGAPDPDFTLMVIHVDNPGWHDTALGDVDGDGDIDLVTKVWNKDGENYHADFWRNETIQKK